MRVARKIYSFAAGIAIAVALYPKRTAHVGPGEENRISA